MRPHIERCIEAGRTSSGAIAADLNARRVAASNGGQRFPMQVRRVRDRLDLSASRGCFVGREHFRRSPAAAQDVPPHALRVTYRVTIEIEGRERLACVAEVIGQHHC